MGRAVCRRRGSELTFAVLTHEQLDDDREILEDVSDGGPDEIYVGARPLDRNGNTVAKVESNRIRGDL